MDILQQGLRQYLIIKYVIFIFKLWYAILVNNHMPLGSATVFRLICLLEGLILIRLKGDLERTGGYNTHKVQVQSSIRSNRMASRDYD